MSLRFKLLLIALSTLALPWAGWQFVRQMEHLLRQGQEQALLASAKALGRSLAALNTEFPAAGAALYVHAVEAPLVIDGHTDDWALLSSYAQNLGPLADAQKLRIVLANDAEWFYLLIEVRDSTRVRVDAHDTRVAISDHLDLLLERNGIRQHYWVANAAPGVFEAMSNDSSTTTVDLPAMLSGEWQEDSQGYRIELRLPQTQMPERLGVSVFDADASSQSREPIRSSPPFESYPLLKYSSHLVEEITPFLPQDMRVRVLSSEAWVMAKSGELRTTEELQPSRRRWLESLIYRGLIAPGLAKAADFSFVLPRLNAAEVWQALSGVAATAWHPAEQEGGVVLAAAVPLIVQGEIRGALLLEQSGDALPLLTNRALLSLMGMSLLAMLFAGAVLFLFASLLSLRIRRLRNATEQALHTNGRLNGHFPMSDARDEIGDLSRSFAKLLDEVGAYTDYLRTLASKLSHELNTPLAIVKSSLDNLDQQAIPNTAQPYVLRARDGAERIGAIVRAMSEASRMERAIASVEGEDFDLRAVVQGCCEAYRTLIGARELRCELPEVPMLMHGSPELIAQALDKLFDNALSFTPMTGWIWITLIGNFDGAEIRFANNGPLLPVAMQERLFDSLVSVRDQSSVARSGEAPHLGLGLSIVRLIAELHSGKASAHNLADQHGVEFRLILRGMARRRMVGES